MTRPDARTLWILKTGDALPSLRAVHGDFEDWIAHGLAQHNHLPALPVRTLDARTDTPWPTMETVINGVRFQLSALLDLKKKAIQGAFFVHD